MWKAIWKKICLKETNKKENIHERIILKKKEKKYWSVCDN